MDILYRAKFSRTDWHRTSKIKLREMLNTVLMPMGILIKLREMLNTVLMPMGILIKLSEMLNSVLMLMGILDPRKLFLQNF